MGHSHDNIDNVGGITVYLITVGVLFVVVLLLFALAMSCKWEKLQSSLQRERYKAMMRRRREESEKGCLVKEEIEEVCQVKEESEERFQAKEKNEECCQVKEKEYAKDIEWVSSV